MAEPLHSLPGRHWPVPTPLPKQVPKPEPVPSRPGRTSPSPLGLSVPWRRNLAGFVEGGIRLAKYASERCEASTAKLGMPGVWAELANRLRVFDSFRHPQTYLELGLGGAIPTSLGEQVLAANALPAEWSLWAVEGFGHEIGQAHALGRGPSVRDLLGQGLLPSQASLPLHTGQGLALATAFLRQRNPLHPNKPAGSKLSGTSAAPSFFDLSQRASAPGLAGATFEALGFVAATFEPMRITTLDRQLESRPDLRPWFWHGVGRGLYFSPLAASPATTRWLILRASGEPPHRVGRDNALSGLLWAITLVNFDRPELMRELLHWIRSRGCEQSFARARDGVASATAIWCGSRGRDPWFERFLDPHFSDPRARRFWQRHVEAPCTQRCARYRRLKRRHRLEDLFAFRSPTTQEV